MVYGPILAVYILIVFLSNTSQKVVGKLGILYVSTTPVDHHHPIKLDAAGE